ncbi:ABC transporter ATP-binding protein [Brevibacterium sp. BRM-1]|uniref:ABC transporter ATP-binding protein n=1 Tax=Brevibacterium sp. BRM-1 TaxID=2999062 RepID=UPI00227DAF53|nr:ABC transporter ATP-binding protein [Brevibacterium sp. BRM-1]WAL40164.1 ABC transporter ATP-binding protein [Brevibacterium sp. BRM-1]
MSTPSPQAAMYRATSSRRTAGDAPARITRATLRRIAGFARPHRAALTAFLALSALASVLGVLTPTLAGRVVNLITGSGPISAIVALAALMAGLALADAALTLANRRLSAGIGEGIIFDLRTAVFDHVQRMPAAFFSRTRTGALVSRLNSDVMGAQRAFSNTLSGVVTNLISVVLTLVVMVTISWQVTALALLLVPIFVLPTRLLAGRLARLQFETADLNAAMSTRMTERFSAGGAILIKLFGSPARESAEFALRAGRVRDIGVRTAMLQAAFVTALTLVSALALALVYGLGGAQAVLGHLDAGRVVALAMLLTRVYTPLTMLANARMDITSAIVSFERVFEILDLRPAIREPEAPRPLPAGPLAVRYDGVRFAYPSASEVSLASLEDVEALDPRAGEEVLHGISFDIPAGHTVALVGSSGAGKSTLASLLPRLHDVTAGAVSVGGVDVRELSFADLRAAVGMVSQDGHLFHESIRENLLLAAPAATDEQLRAAVEAARLGEVLAELPDGLDTVIGERGYRLSGGERQRLTIARMLLAAPPVVVLDEATSALDSTNEAAVQDALAHVMEHSTALVIAHRLSTVRSADEILVIEHGAIVERGPHARLLVAGGRYAQLYETQFARQDG